VTPLRFQTLGSIDLRDDAGRPLHSVLAQPKRLAFLAYLAVEAHGGYVRRDSVIGLFWPELDERHARQNLRQTLHELRRGLGSTVFLARGNQEVGLSPQAIDCDATEFLADLEADRLEDALDVYGGELLPGFHLSEAREFSGWLDRAREHFGRLAVQAASDLAELEWSRGHVEAALSRARRALDLSPYDEACLRRLLGWLAERGRRAQAIVEYDRFADRLRRELEIEPSPETQAYVRSLAPEESTEEVFNGPRVQGSPGEERRADGESAETPDHEPPPLSPPGHDARDRDTKSRRERPEAGERRRLKRAVAAAVGLTAGIMATLSLLPTTVPDAEPALDSGLIAALPFETPAASPELEPLGEGLVLLLYHALSSSPGTRLTYPPTSFDLWADGRSEAPEVRDAAAIRVATRLGAGRLLRGTLVGSETGVTVHAELRRVPDGKVLASPSVRGSLDDLSGLVDALATQLMVAGESFAPEDALGDVSSEALEQYVAGLQASRRGDWLEAVRHHRAAMAIDSTFGAPALQMLLAAWQDDREPEVVDHEAEQLAWALRNRMSEGDRAHVMALVGPVESQPKLSARDWVRAAEGALDDVPDRPQMYETLARWLLNYGPALRIEDWADRVTESVDRSLRLTDRPSRVLVRMGLAATRHGSLSDDARRTRARMLVNRFGGADGLASLFAYVATGDTAYFHTFETEELPRLKPDEVVTVANYTTHEGLATTAWRAAVDSLARRALLPRERLAARYHRSVLAAAEGRPSEAGPILRQLVEDGYEEFHGVWWFLRTGIDRALIEPGWEETAAWAATRIVDLPDSLIQAARPDLRECYLGLAAVVADDLVSARDLLAGIRDRSGDFLLCAKLLDTLIEVGGTTVSIGGTPAPDRSDDAWTAVAELDRAMVDLPLEPTVWITSAVLARLWWARGDATRALVAARRRGRHWPWLAAGGVPAQMLIEARASAALGDTATAIRAYGQYLRLRREPDEWMRARVDSARNELAALKG